jgi:hypothetical protein
MVRISAKAAVAALAIAAMAAPAAAQSYQYGQPAYSQGYGQPAYGQSYGQSQPYYDECVRDQRQRQVTGGLLGAAIGAGVGRGVASRNARTGGGLIGAALGAMAGANVGRATAACESQAYGQPSAAGYGYDNSQYGYDNRYPANDYGQGHGYGYDDRYGSGYGQPVQDTRYQNTDGCRLSESRVQLPDGREDVRYVRVCPDQNGRYRIVD